MVTDLIIKDCDKKFAEMVRNIHRAYAMRVKCGVQINFSGGSDFNYLYVNVHPDNATKLVRVEIFEEKDE